MKLGNDQVISSIIESKDSYEILRDSAIQRFEYCVDTLCKYLRAYLIFHSGIDQSHPKPMLRECFKAKLIDQKETEVALGMIDDRNMTSHAYHEKAAEKIFKKIPGYLKFMKKLANNIKPA